MELLVSLSETLIGYGHFAYLAMFLILIACGFGLPIPEDIVLVTGGILVAAGVCQLNLVIFVTLAGVLIGDGIIFHMGRHFGPRVTSKWPMKLFLNPARLEKTKAIFEKNGEKVIFMARFMPGFRMPIFLTSGSFGVKPWKFWVFDGVAALISVPTLVYAGDKFAENLEYLENLLREIQLIILLVLVFGIMIFAWVKLRKKNTTTA